MARIQEQAELAFEKLVKRSGLRGWAMMAQNRLGSSGWEFQLQTEPKGPQDNRVQVTVGVSLSLG